MPKQKKQKNKVVHQQRKISHPAHSSSKGMVRRNAKTLDIRKEADNVTEKVKESEQRLHFILENCNIGIWEMDSLGRYTYCSPQMKSLLGYDPEEMVGKTPFEMMPREKRSAAVKQFLSLAISSVAFSGMELTFNDSYGRLITVELSGVPFFDERGQVLGYRGISRDITERKNAEDMLRTSERRLSDIIESSPIDIAIIGLDKKFIEVNRAVVELHGLSCKSEVIGKDYLHLVDPAYHKKAADAWDATLRTGYLRDLELTQLRRDGQKIHTLICGTVLKDAEGKPYAVLVMVQDITERIKFQEALRESEEKYRNLVEFAPLAICEMDADGTQLFSVNNAASELMGYSREELLAMTPADMMDQKSRSIYQERLRKKAVGQKLGEVIEYRGKKKNGEWIDALIKIGDISYSNNKPLRIVVAALDITERKKAEEILKRDNETLERLVQKRSRDLVKAQIELERAKRLSDIGTLAATVAHELRNPLAAIGMTVTNIQRKLKDVAGLHLNHHFQTIDKKIGESNQIINNLLFYSKLRAPEFKPVDIYPILKECVDLAEKQTDRKIVFKRQFDSVKKILIDADYLQIQEAFSNLLNNARDAVDEKNDGWIEITAQHDDDVVHVSIKDNGIGIPEENLERIFDPFFTTKAKGTGLGLTVCSQIVKMHGGSVIVASDASRGTTVELVLPKRRGNHHA